MYPFTFSSYLIYQAERQRSAADQREADVRAGELAASIAKIGHAVKAAVTRRAGNRLQEPAMAGDDLIPVGKCRDGFCPSKLTAVPAQPAPRTAR